MQLKEIWRLDLIKTGHYRRASQVIGEQMSLEQALGLCSDGYPNAGFPIFDYVEGLQCVVASHRVVEGRQQLHLAVFEAGAGAAVVETMDNVRVDEEPAPEQKEFIRSQMFLICSDGDVIFTSHNSPLRDSRAATLINALVARYSGTDSAPTYVFQAALDEERYRQIMDQGIGEIDLGIAGFTQTLEHALQDGTIEQSGLGSVIASLWNRDLTDADREAAAKISGRFILRPGHDWSNIEVKGMLTDMAMNLLDEGNDDGFAIVTKNGLRVTQDTVRLKESFSVDGNRQVVNRNQMFTGLHNAFESFEELGVLGEEMLIDDGD